MSLPALVIVVSMVNATTFDEEEVAIWLMFQHLYCLANVSQEVWLSPINQVVEWHVIRIWQCCNNYPKLSML